VCFICGTLPTGTLTVCIPNLFPPKENHNVGLLRFDDDHDHICYRFAQVQIFGGKSNVFKSLQVIQSFSMLISFLPRKYSVSFSSDTWLGHPCFVYSRTFISSASFLVSCCTSSAVTGKLLISVNEWTSSISESFSNGSLLKPSALQLLSPFCSESRIGTLTR
jgi:hypothetical protein